MSFLCNLDIFLLKNVIVFIFEKQILKWRSFEKRDIFDLFSFLFTREKTQNFIQHVTSLLSIFAPCRKGRWLHEQNQPICSYPQHSYKPWGRCCQQWYHLPISSLVILVCWYQGPVSIRMRLGRCMLLILHTWPNQDSCDSVMRARILLGLNLQEEILKRTSSLRILSFQVMLRTFL